MTSSSRNLLSALIALYLIIPMVHGQSPAPIVVQAATPPPQVSTTVAATAQQDSSSVETAIKLLEEMKAKNDEILSKQQATLQQLDELQQAAEQLRIYAKRG
jgi:hypothetical protein